MTDLLSTAKPGTGALSVERGGPVPPAPAPGDDVLAWYDHWVRERPGLPAVEDGDRIWTYAELDAAADGVADALRGRVGPGDMVAVCLERSADLVATAVALARLGAVYLPLGPRPGERRLEAALREHRVACVVGAPDVAAGAVDIAGAEAALPLSGSVVAAFRTDGRPAPAGTFYAVLTSGSTGTPKAVAVGAESFGSLVRWYGDLLGAAPGERHSLLIGVAFDPHLQEMWTALAWGATLCVAPDEVRWDLDALTGWWRRSRVTASILPTPLAEPVLDRPWPAGLSLRYLVIGGDRLRRSPGPDVTAQVYNVYGPAEATVSTTVHPLGSGQGPDTAAPPIGRPIAGAVVYVTDDQGGLLPRGEAGELRIGGAGLALGYLDEELTARRFVPAPPEAAGAGRVYRTGDRVVMRAGGVLEFLGRMDDQVKISGVRIEPAEVEAAFERDPRVRRAVVAVRRTAEGLARLEAFVLAVPGERPAAAQLTAAVRGWLPEQAVPTQVHLVDAFPFDANGKVDRARLVASATPGGDTVGTPGSEEEGTAELVLRLCRDLFGRPDIGLSDNFTDSGGDSITAARLLKSIKDAYGIRVKAPELLRQPDLRGLVALIDNRRAARAPKPTRPAPADRTAEPREPGPQDAETAGIPATIAAYAERHPDALAATDGERALTYRQLVTAARRLAADLAAHGVAPGSAVGLLRSPSVRAVIAPLAIWLAGGHYVPLDPSYPRARTEQMMADAGVTLTIGDKDALDRAGLASAGTFVLPAEIPATEPASAPAAPHDPESIAYVMYTSGSTGRPKPVAVTHRGISGLVTGIEYATITERDRVLFHSPATFDAAAFELWAPLGNGAAVVVSPTERPSLEELVREVERRGVTVAFLTTSLFHQLAARRSRVFGVLRTVIVGGETLSPQHARSVLRAFPWVELVNGYGPTENTTFTTAHRVTDRDCDGPVPIGVPINGTTVHVLGEDGAPVPPGTRGELWIGGTRLARGYLGQPERTAESFVDHPTAGRLYRSGDLVSLSSDGTLAFHGRVDDQVKVRGFRIEPGEVEHALRAHPAVDDVAVVVQRPGPDDARLTAFVVPDDTWPGTERVRAELAERLPAHLVPDVWTVLDRLPLTGSGKVDRRALAERRPQRDGGDAAVELSPFQQAVADVWAGALAVPVTSPDADFFALGGHSLLALEIVDDLRQNLGVEISIADFLGSPTVAGQAELLERALLDVHGDALENTDDRH